MSCFINPEKLEKYKSALRVKLSKSITKKASENAPIDIKVEAKSIYDFFKAQGANEALAQDAAAITPFLIDQLITNIQEFKDLVVKANPKIRSQLAVIIESYEEDINNVKKDLGISVDLPIQLAEVQEIRKIVEASCFIDKNNIENFKEVIGLFAASKINKLVNDGKTIELDALSKAVYDYFKEQGIDEALAQDAGAALPFVVNDLMIVNEFVELIKKVNPKIRSEVIAKIESYEEDINNVKKDLGISLDLPQKLAAAKEIATTEAQEADDEISQHEILRTFLFIDYETFDKQTRGGRASQFAAIRTDKDLNILKDRSINLFCEQTIDHLPSPTASRITGLTPQKISRFKNGLDSPPEGNIACRYEVLNEYFFTKRILSEMAEPNTCTLGYNNIVFDDEFTRNLAYRNLFDPYRHEWASGNSRFDVYHLVLATYVLKPHLLNFPDEKDGEVSGLVLIKETDKALPSFKLEKLSIANGINHGSAHDAFSDVEATIGIMKIILDTDSDFFYSIYRLRKKENVDSWLLDSKRRTKPFLHISSFYGKINHCLAVLITLNNHPTNKNARICLNLSSNIKLILQLPVDELRERLFMTNAELKTKDIERPGIVILKINQCPILAEIKDVSERMSELGLDADLLQSNLNLVNQFEKELRTKLGEIFNVPYEENISDTDLMIYSGGFFSQLENFIKQKVHRAAENNGLKEFDYSQCSDRLKQMIFKFKARNFPESLNEDEQVLWKKYSLGRITEQPQIKGLYDLSAFYKELEDERANCKNDDVLQLLYELEEYVNELKRIHGI